MHAHALMVWHERARVVLSTALPNVRRATLGGRLATTRPSVSVGALVLACAHEYWPTTALCRCLCWTFAANTCKCNNGVAKTGAGCPVNGAEKCAACVKGWTINHAGTKCIRTCTHVCMGRESLDRSVIVFVALLYWCRKRVYLQQWVAASRTRLSHKRWHKVFKMQCWLDP